MSKPPKLELSGTPREIGLAHGQQLATQIRSQIDVYNEMFKQTSKLTWTDVRFIAEGYRDTLKRLVPDIYEEMEGIAEGAGQGLDVLDIVAINARSEIALGLFSDGCTAMGWKRQGTAVDNDKNSDSGVVWLAQNWDWTARVKENLAMMSIKQSGKPTIYMVTEAGVVGKIGFNSSSVGTCLNAIRARPTDASKLPIHVALRVCLDSTSAGAAMEKLESLGVASSQHILIADASGPLSLELSPRGHAVLHPSETGFISHTNHFLQNRLVEEPPWLADSFVRLSRINKLAEELGKMELSGELLRKRIFSDGCDGPGSICRSENPNHPVQTRSSTLFSIVMKFSKEFEPSAEVVWGKPIAEKDQIVLNMPW